MGFGIRNLGGTPEGALLTFLWVPFHDRPGSGGQRSPRVRSAMAARAWNVSRHSIAPHRVRGGRDSESIAHHRRRRGSARRRVRRPDPSPSPQGHGRTRHSFIEVSHPGVSGRARMPITARWSTSAPWQWPAVRAGARRWPIFRCEAALLADWLPAIPQPSVTRPWRLDAGHDALMGAELLVGVGGGGRDGCGCLGTRREADPRSSPVPVVVPIPAPPVLD